MSGPRSGHRRLLCRPCPVQYRADMRSFPGRPVGVIAALAAALWSFVLLPPQQHAFSGAYAMPKWLFDLDRLPVYDAARDWLVSVGLPDFYIAFGAAASVSFILVWFAAGPPLAGLGWSGRVLSWLILAGAPITVLSYLSTPTTAPTHWLWGAEGPLLVLIGLWAIVVAFAAPRRSGVRVWERLLVGFTLPILAGATLLLSYWPHGTLVGLGLEAAALAAWGARPATAGAEADGADEVRLAAG